jgi:hypothetical protein
VRGIRGVVTTIAAVVGLVAPVAPAAPATPAAVHPASADSRFDPDGMCGEAEPSAWRHVVWIWMENKDNGDIVGSPDAPFLDDLAAACGRAGKYLGVAHPSLANYITATSGGTQGITDDARPAEHPLDEPSIFSQLGPTGWQAYEESMDGNCNRVVQGPLYAVRHNPPAYYTNIAADCDVRDVPMPDAFDLSPAFTFITPNLCHDMHECEVAVGDAWLADVVAKIAATPEYAGGTTVLVITWDENEGPHHKPKNRIPTFVVAASVPPGTVAHRRFDHYSLLRTTEQMLGLPPLGLAKDARSMRRAFHL